MPDGDQNMRFLFFITLFLISYGSLYPFDFSARGGGMAELRAMFDDLALPSSKGDLIGNILLFVPPGLLIAWRNPVAGPAVTALAAFRLGLAAFLAFALQVAQIWLPSRVPALGDVFTNIFGLLLGYVSGITCRRMLPEKISSHIQQVAFPLMLLSLWVVCRWFPLVPTLDLQNLKNGLKLLLLHPQFDAIRALAIASGWLVFFRLADFISAFAPDFASGFLSCRKRPVPVILFVALGITLAQPFFVNRDLQLYHLAGLACAGLALPLLRRSWANAAIGIILLASVLLSGLSPFTFSWEGSGHGFQWTPFAGMLDGSMLLNLAVLIEKTFFYGSLIFILHANGARPGGATVLVMLWVALIEVIQIFIAGKTAEITDPILAAMLGCALAAAKRSATAGRDGFRPPTAVSAKRAYRRH
jgi:VanZ family protein